ncbi:Zinc finger, C2H2 type [Popillia japonica]|uniref:Zinc finger, C2H2 type n=1 Tax=Popillia japonica TaxID=7064 RepID=A0AAW1KG81_POPJA
MSQFISGLNVSPYGCSVCGKCYKYQHSLYRHIKYECGKPPNFACPYPSQLVTRSRYVCIACGKSYSYVHSLKRHKKIECGKQPKVFCPVKTCSYKTKYKSSLKSHLRLKHFIYDADLVSSFS